MPVFEYKGTDEKGRSVKGRLQAESLAKARVQLKKDRVFLLSLKDKSQPTRASFTFFKRRRVDIKTLCNTTRMLSTLLKANVPLVESLQTIAKQTSHPVLKNALTNIARKINEGHSFYKSLSEYPHIFDSSYVSMCEAGESSGTLDVVLVKLAEFTEDQAELVSKIRSTMAYPTLIILFTFGVVLFLFTYIIPKITVLFEEEDMILPWYTSAVMSLSETVIQSWQVLLMGAAGAVFLFYRFLRTDTGRHRVDSVMLRLPLIGDLARAMAISRFTRTLATLLNGGVAMLVSMKIAQNTINNSILKKAIVRARSHIREGEAIARPLEESGQFPPMTIQMIKVGEKTGELENMLFKISDTYDMQIRTEVDTLTSLLGPVMVIFMGGVVGFIIFSVMVPIFEMYNQIES